MFDGRDYHQAFREARDELAVRVLDRDEVLGQLDTRVNLARAGGSFTVLFKIGSIQAATGNQARMWHDALPGCRIEQIAAALDPGSPARSTSAFVAIIRKRKPSLRMIAAELAAPLHHLAPARIARIQTVGTWDLRTRNGRTGAIANPSVGKPTTARATIARAGVEAAIALIFQHHHSVAGDHGHIRGPQ